MGTANHWVITDDKRTHFRDRVTDGIDDRNTYFYLAFRAHRSRKHKRTSSPYARFTLGSHVWSASIYFRFDGWKRSGHSRFSEQPLFLILLIFVQRGYSKKKICISYFINFWIFILYFLYLFFLIYSGYGGLCNLTTEWKPRTKAAKACRISVKMSKECCKLTDLISSSYIRHIASMVIAFS